MSNLHLTAEYRRLIASETRQADWKAWGPYLSERAWGTVREDYSADGSAWTYFPHDHARSRAYRWNEDGLGGISNRFQNVCLAVGLWNEKDPILKERLFGVTGPQGNHGEDVKEYYFYLDSTPTHSYMKMLYKYPQVAFPYERLVEENAKRGKDDPEFELMDALREDFATGRYFDVVIEYAKADEEDILWQITVINRGSEAAPIHVLPQIWFRNTWGWGYPSSNPMMRAADNKTIQLDDRHVGVRSLYLEKIKGHGPTLMFTGNDTNRERVFGQPNDRPYVKDAFHTAVVQGDSRQTNPEQIGTKAAGHYHKILKAGEQMVVRGRFTNQHELATPFADFTQILKQRIQEADEYYAALQRHDLSADEKMVQRQAFAGLLWTKQFYHYSVELWLKGDPASPPPPQSRKGGRNRDWQHLYTLDVLSMPDKWEYPWFAAWDLAFHCIPIAMIDPEWAKRQLILLLRDWYMHPNGQIPAYEWAFGDVNPPVHAWAVWRVYKIARNVTGKADVAFLKRAFHKLLLNFTWWVNRKDADGNNVFSGGFLGLDNIGLFDRSAPLPTGGHLDQADGTAWMGMFCLNMLAIALELARHDRAYEDVATKFFEHFVYIATALSTIGGQEGGLWDEQDGFFYDILHLPDGRYAPLKVRSFVGLIPLFAVETLEADLLEMLPNFRRRMEWFLRYRPGWVANIAPLLDRGEGGRRLLAVVNQNQLTRILQKMLDPQEFLSDYGLRALSRTHLERPYRWSLDRQTLEVKYEPAESSTGLFGGNSNWRGPIWIPVNFLMIEALQKFHHYYGDTLKVEMPTGSGQAVNLWDAAGEISRRLNNIFLRQDNRRPVFGGEALFQNDPHWRDHVLFYEYFHGDNGAGIGASHQTGWTALIAKLLQQSGGE
ncbi:MAG: glucosidase [Anaerolineae bacterium]|nr:glucosidase [Anaerolineae bacterium]